MRLAFNTSSYSFKFIGFLLIVIGIILISTGHALIAAVFFFLGILLAAQSAKYIIPQDHSRVAAQVIKTLDLLAIRYTQEYNVIKINNIAIKIKSLGLVTYISFTWHIADSIKGKYIAKTIVKYQRYS